MSIPQRIILWTLALMPVGAAVLVHQQGRSPTLAISPRTLPALAFDQYLVDLGPVQPTSEVRANFLFRHRGTFPAKIVELTPSCGCLQPKLQKKIYDPGDVDGLVVRVQPANESPGKHEYTVDIKYLDPEPREARVTFRVTLPEKGISITPPAMMVFQFGEQETVRDVLITDTRGERWNVMGVQTSLPFVKVEAGEPAYTESGTFEQPVQITVPAKVNGRQRGLVTIYTDSPQYPELKIPLLVQGPEATEGDATEQHTVP